MLQRLKPASNPRQLRRRLLLSLCALLALTSVSPVLAQQPADSASEEDYSKEPDLIAKARSLGNFKTLIAAADAADLIQTLSEDGPYTLFAPSDAAFKRLPKDMLDRLMTDKPMLRQLLLYHVVRGRQRARTVIASDSFDTLADSGLKRKDQAGLHFIDSSRILQTDIQARNGVIHEIDKVLLPPGFAYPLE